LRKAEKNYRETKNIFIEEIKEKNAKKEEKHQTAISK